MNPDSLNFHSNLELRSNTLKLPYSYTFNQKIKSSKFILQQIYSHFNFNLTLVSSSCHETEHNKSTFHITITHLQGKNMYKMKMVCENDKNAHKRGFSDIFLTFFFKKSLKFKNCQRLSQNCSVHLKLVQESTDRRDEMK